MYVYRCVVLGVAARLTLTRLYSILLHIARSGNSFQPLKGTQEGTGNTRIKPLTWLHPYEDPINSKASMDLCALNMSVAWDHRAAIRDGASRAYLLKAAATILYPGALLFSNLHIPL